MIHSFRQVFSILFFLVLFCGMGKGLNAQNSEIDSISIQSRITFSDPSYITLRGGVGNIENLVYQANLAPDLTLRFKKYPNLALELTPHILLRMIDQYSHPVRTPSFMPKATVYYRLKGNSPEKETIPFLTFGHHSNGQEGGFYYPDSLAANGDSIINKVDGSFSLNYFTGGVMLLGNDDKIFNPMVNAKFSVQYCLIRQLTLKDIYGKYRFSATLESDIAVSKEKPDFVSQQMSRSKITSSLQAGWIAGEMLNAKALDLNRLIFSWTLSYQPARFSDFALFARYYYGQDYYNINFDRTLSLLQFGLSIKKIGN